MQNPYHFTVKRLKQMMPRSLFGRALLILVLPTILMQILAIVIFYDRHWENIRRHLSSSLAGEVAVVVDRAMQVMPEQRPQALKIYAETMNMSMWLQPLPIKANDGQHERFHHYIRELRRRLDMPFVVRQTKDGEAIQTFVALPDQVIRIDVSNKRLESSTTYIFVYWVVSSAILLTLIAILFLRNQIRPIARLAEAAERFGVGQDVGDFRPHGAEEVRKAGRAFMVMRSRITRQISARTAMLSGISHDLRTPLTRLKLQLAMLGEGEEIQAMRQDVQEMEFMLNEYLEFARGNDESIPAEEVDIAEWLRGVLQPHLMTGASVTYSFPETIDMAVRSGQLKRVVENIISNALKYGKECHVSLELAAGWVSIIVEDKGPGIPEEAMEDVFRPFTRLEDSRNSQTGGVGLGLAIARDIVQSHGGKIQMRNMRDAEDVITGLAVTILLPLTGG